MSSGDLAQLERCCEAFYNGGEQQTVAHEVLLPLASDPQALPKLQAVLAESTNQNALIFASSALLKQFTEHWAVFSEVQKEDTKRYLLNTLYNMAGELAVRRRQLLNSLLRLLCRLLKLGWLERVTNQNVTELVKRFLQGSTAHWIVGLMIYAGLTEDMMPHSGASFPRSRRTAISYREVALPEVFTTAISAVSQVKAGGCASSADEERFLLRHALQLLVAVLSYDFSAVGALSESDDKRAMVALPSAMVRQVDATLVASLGALYFQAWRGGDSGSARLALQAVVLLAQVRGLAASLAPQFRDLSREVLQTAVGLQDDNCLHELCRLLARMTPSSSSSGGNSSSTASSSGPDNWLQLAFNFTLQSFQQVARLPQSQHYLVHMWCNASSARDPEVKALIPQVAVAFLQSRLALAAVEDDEDSLLEDPMLRAEQLDALKFLSQSAFGEVSEAVSDGLAQVRAASGAVASKITVLRYAWLVFVAGDLLTLAWRHQRLSAFALTVPPSRVIESNSAKAVPFVSAVLQLMDETDGQPQAPQILEQAYLHFLEALRDALLAAKDNEPAPILDGLTASRQQLLERLVDKLLLNLRGLRAQDEALVRQTLGFLQESTSGISLVAVATQPTLMVSGQLMLKSQKIDALLRDHRNAEFLTFLQIPQYGRYRTQYYANVTRLHMMRSETCEKADFLRFLEPFRATLDPLRASVNDPAVWANPLTKKTIIELARDLRGVADALRRPEEYARLFDFLVDFPKSPADSRIDVFLRALLAYSEESCVTTPVLKFYAELVHNRQERIAFPLNSPNGVFLFKLVTKVLSSFGSRLLASPPPVKDVYRNRYKAVAACLSIFCHCTTGAYTNFGVFEAFNDNSLTEALALAMRLALSIPAQDLQAYLKALNPVYALFEAAFKHFMLQVVELPAEVHHRVLNILEDGLCAFEQNINSQSCHALEHLLNWVISNQDENPHAQRFLAEQNERLQRLLSCLFSIVCSTETAWHCSAPMFALVRIFPNQWNCLRDEMIARQQSEDRRLALTAQFQDLMEGVNLSSSLSEGRDRFCQNLWVFMQAVRNLYA